MKLLQKTFFVMLGKGHWSKNKEIIFYTENPSRKLIWYTIYHSYPDEDVGFFLGQFLEFQ